MSGQARTIPEFWDVFWSNVAKSDGCWEWTGHRHMYGYGLIAIPGGRQERTHRIVWLAATGTLPEGLQVLHTCDNPPCVNPAHLWLGTNLDNARDREAKGRHGQPRRWDLGLVCKRGHDRAIYTREYTRSSSGHPRRNCGKCHAEGERSRCRRLQEARS